MNQILRKHPFAAKNRRSWVLGRGELILASCETFRMKSTTEQGEVGGFSESLAAFYVEPGFRGKGYAAELVAQLSGIFRREHVQAAIIFSQIQERLYWQGGYQPMKGHLWSFAQEDFRNELLGEEKKLPVPRVSWFAPQQVGSILGKAGFMVPGAFRIHVTQEQIDWHLCKERFYAEALRQKPVERLGAVMDQGWILWTHDFVSRQLLVLWMEASTREESQHLIAAALDEAAQYGFQRVLVWPNPPLHSTLGFGRRAPFKEVPMILPIAPELRASDWTCTSPLFKF